MSKLKVKVEEVTPEHLERVRSYTVKRMQAYIKDHPKCSALDMVFKKKITTMKFLSNNVVCTNCGHIEENGSYIIAQKAQGHSVTFTCECGNRFAV